MQVARQRKVHVVAPQCPPGPRCGDATDSGDGGDGGGGGGGGPHCAAHETTAFPATDSARFDASPRAYIDRDGPLWAAYGAAATYVVTFDAYVGELEPTLLQRGFVRVATFAHADVRYDYDDPFPKKEVVVYHRGKQQVCRETSLAKRRRNQS